LLGAIEAGGTKFVCAVSDDGNEILKQITILTTSPEKTFEQVFNFFDQYPLTSIGVGSFGPIDMNKQSKTYGYITNTPKEGWKNVNFIGKLKERYNVSIAWTTDVNAAAYGEYRKGVAEHVSSCLYVTVGTGIGGGAIINGMLLEGLGHPEMGHIPIRKHCNDYFKGICPIHHDCLEGLTSGPAIKKRYGIKASKLPKDHQVWNLVAYYLAQALFSYTLILRPDKIILGGGVMKQTHLFPLIRDKFRKSLNNYLSTAKLTDYIVSPKLKDKQALIGCFLLAKELIKTNK